MSPVGQAFIALFVTQVGTSTDTVGSIASPPAEVDEELVVRGQRLDREVAETRIDGLEAGQIPGTGGDVFRAVETLAGVARSAVGSGELTVWGASPGDTRAYINDVPVPRLFHLGGSRSIFPTSWVSSVNLVPGGFGPDYGRAVGGLIRAESQPGAPPDGVAGYARADVIDAGGGFAAAITPAVSVEASARVSVLEETFGRVIDEDSRQLVPVPRYFDYQGRVAYESSGDRFYELLAFGSDDKVDRSSVGSARRTPFSEITRDSFHRLAARYDRLSWDGTSTRATLWFGIDRHRSTLTFERVPAGREGTTLLAGLRVSERRRISDWGVLLLGVDIETARAELSQSGALTLPAREGDLTVFGLPPGDRVNEDDWTVVWAAAAAFFEFELQFFDGLLSIEPGLRVEPSITNGDRILPTRGPQLDFGYTDFSFAFDPRLRAAVRPFEPLQLSVSLGVFHQPVSRQDLSPVFGNPRLGSMRATHLVASAKYDVMRGGSVEATIFSVALSDRAVRSRLPTPAQAKALIDDGTGRNAGAQLALRYQPSPSLFAWISYSLMRAERRDGPDESERLFDQDQTHVLTALGGWTWAGRLEIGGRVRYATGAPRTPVVDTFFNAQSGLFEPVYGAQNSMRLPAFFELSVRIAYTWRAEWASVLAYLDLQNVTNRENAEELFYSSDFSRRDFITGLPVLPVFGVKASF